jgi:hypothetical protein
MSADEKLAELGLELPNVPTPLGNYIPFRRDGDVIIWRVRGRAGWMVPLSPARLVVT